MSTKEENLRYAARKYAAYDPTANDCAHEIESVVRKVQAVFGPLAAAAIAIATEDVPIYASDDDSALRDNLLTGIRERAALKWYAMTRAGKSAEEISLTSHSNVRTIQDSVRQVEDFIQLSMESQEETGTEVS